MVYQSFIQLPQLQKMEGTVKMGCTTSIKIFAFSLPYIVLFAQPTGQKHRLIPYLQEVKHLAQNGTS